MAKRNIVSGPLLSVIVPFYNTEIFLPKCIESIRQQTYSNLEIILVNNGSTDHSNNVCERYQKCDSRIKVIYEKMRGAVAARKAGVKIAAGQYAAYVDSDDWIEPDMYKTMMDRIGDADIIACGLKQDINAKCIGYQTSALPPGVYCGEGLTELHKKMIYTGHFYSWGVQSSVVSKIYKTELLRRNQLKVPNEIRMGEDPACLYPALLEIQKIIIIEECFYHYQIRNDSVMGISDKQELERYKVLFSYLKKCFSQHLHLKENLLFQLKHMMVYYLLFKNIEVFQNGKFLFPYSGVMRGSKVAVYGAGRFGSEVVRYLNNTQDYTFVVWVDKNVNENIQPITILREIDFDFILIAALKEGLKEEMSRQADDMGISREKIKIADMDLIEKASLSIEDILA
ncbi:MAG: glycosyltransferase [Ruminococcus sp.]|nr:glycosyltransferase [Ruminococcus sp.]